MKLLNKILYILGVTLILIIGVTPSSVKALDNGAYIIPVTATYENPETGSTVDGGSNVALGQSMIDNIVSKEALLECENGRNYITLRLGLMSSISSVNFEVQTSSGGGYKSVSSTQTASRADNNKTIDFRFEVVDPNLLISPILYVTPMGRNVQFFVKPNVSGARAGSGDFVSMISSANDKNSNSNNTNSGNTSSANENKNMSNSASNNSDNLPQASVTNPEASTEVKEEASQEAAKSNQESLIEKSEEAKQEEEAKKAEMENESIEDIFNNVQGITVHKLTSEESIQTESENIGIKIGIILVLVISAAAGGFVLYRKKFNKVR